MKKTIIMAAISVSILCMTGCGGNKTASPAPDAETKDTAGAAAVTETAEPLAAEESSDAAAGVYLNAGTLETVEMGTALEGQQKELCTIKMPSEYLFAACYTGEGGASLSFVGASGSTSLGSVKEEKILEESEFVPSYVLLQSLAEDESCVSFTVQTAEENTLEQEKSSAPDGADLGTEDHPAYYHANTNEYLNADLIVVYQIDESALLSMTYRGPLADTSDLETLAQSMYDLVTVAE